MVSVKPGRWRDVVVHVDTVRRAVVYSDMDFSSTGHGSGDGDNIVAMVLPTGSIVGWRMGMKSVMADSELPLDTARIRSMRPNAVTKSTRESLDTAAQRRVRDMVEWLRKRHSG